MSHSDLLKKVRKIEIKTRRLSRQIFAGEYHSAFKGRGMAFSEVREYQFGDDVRSMDWNVTARLNSPYVKVFEEERELTVMLLVDVSGSRLFGSTTRTKKELVTEIAAVLAFSASSNNDKVGALFFSSGVEKFIPPKKGRTHMLRIVRELLFFEPKHKGTDISEALRYLSNVLKSDVLLFYCLICWMSKKIFRQDMSMLLRLHLQDMICMYYLFTTEGSVTCRMSDL